MFLAMRTKIPWFLPILMMLGFLTETGAVGKSPNSTPVPTVGVETTPIGNPAIEWQKPRMLQPFRSLKYLSKYLSKLDKKGVGSDSDGTWLAVSGLVFGVLVIVSWIISPFLGILTTIPLGLIGLLLSIFGLKKARKRWYRTKAIRAVAIAGIALNGLLLLLFLGLLAWASS